MNDIALYEQGTIAALPETMNSSMLMDFIKWIDGSEQTTRTYLTNLHQFMKWMEATNVTQPTREDILSYRQYLTDSGKKPATVRGYLRSVKQFFSWTASEGLYPDIAKNVKAPKVDSSIHKKDALTASEVLNIEHNIEKQAAEKTAAAKSADKDKRGRIQRSTEQGKRLYAMYLLAVNTGMRTVEIHRANVKDIETRRGKSWIYIYGKGRTEADQKKPLAPEVAAAIKDYLKSRNDAYTKESPLFVSTGNRSAGKRIATTTISTMLKKAMVEAGYDSERLTAHSLRHTAGTAVQELTGDLFQTQHYMRHANPATTEIYLHNSTEKQEEDTASRLYDYYHGVQESNDLAAALAKLTTAQQAQLMKMAAAMAS